MKPVRSAGSRAEVDRRQDPPPQRRQPPRAERRRGFLDVPVEIAQHRLHRAHHEGQADEGQRHDDAEGRIGDLPLERCEQLPDPAVRGIERGQRDAGDGRRQGEGQVDDRLDDAAAEKLVAHQHPGDEEPEDGVDAGRRQRGEEGQFQRRQRPRVGGQRDEFGEAEAGGGEDEGAERDQHDQREIEQREAEGRAEARNDALLAQAEKSKARHRLRLTRPACRSGRRRRRRRRSAAAPPPSRRSRRWS